LIVCPANENGVVGIKPTVGLTSRAGVVPISHSQDTVGPHARTVADAAAVLTAIVSRTADPRDPATSTGRNLIPPDYTAFVDAHGLQGARIGIPRAGVFDTIPSIVSDAFDAAVRRPDPHARRGDRFQQRTRRHGAEVVRFLATLLADPPQGHRVTGRAAKLARARPLALRI